MKQIYKNLFTINARMHFLLIIVYCVSASMYASKPPALEQGQVKKSTTLDTEQIAKTKTWFSENLSFDQFEDMMLNFVYSINPQVLVLENKYSIVWQINNSIKNLIELIITAYKDKDELITKNVAHDIALQLFKIIKKAAILTSGELFIKNDFWQKYGILYNPDQKIFLRFHDFLDIENSFDKSFNYPEIGFIIFLRNEIIKEAKKQQAVSEEAATQQLIQELSVKESGSTISNSKKSKPKKEWISEKAFSGFLAKGKVAIEKVELDKKKHAEKQIKTKMAQQAALEEAERQAFIQEQEELRKKFALELAQAKTAPERKKLQEQEEVERQQLIQEQEELQKKLELEQAQIKTPLTSPEQKFAMSKIDPEFVQQVASVGMDLAMKLMKANVFKVNKEEIGMFPKEGGAEVYHDALNNPYNMAYLIGYVQNCIWQLQERQKVKGAGEIRNLAAASDQVSKMIEVLKVAVGTPMLKA